MLASKKRPVFLATVLVAFLAVIAFSVAAQDPGGSTPVDFENRECDVETFLPCNWQYNCANRQVGFPCDTCTASHSVSVCDDYLENHTCREWTYTTGASSCGFLINGTCQMDQYENFYCDDDLTEEVCPNPRKVCQDITNP